MRKTAIMLAACVSLAASPVAASDDTLNARIDQINTLYSKAFDMPNEQRAEARDMFLQITEVAENALKELEGLDSYSIRDLRQQAGNAYYYAAEHEHWMAKEVDDPTQLNAQMLVNLEKGLSHLSKVFADGIDGLLVAEFYFTTALLVEHGLKTSDPRTTEWAKTNVYAARLRIEESGLLGIDSPAGATSELIDALLDQAKVTGDRSNDSEVMELFEGLPEDRRGYSLKRRLRKEGLLAK